MTILAPCRVGFAKEQRGEGAAITVAGFTCLYHFTESRKDDGDLGGLCCDGEADENGTGRRMAGTLAGTAAAATRTQCSE